MDRNLWGLGGSRSPGSNNTVLPDNVVHLNHWLLLSAVADDLGETTFFSLRPSILDLAGHYGPDTDTDEDSNKDMTMIATPSSQ
jgi:hypothetical protein